MRLSLSRFWSLLETGFPLAGPLGQLRAWLGLAVATALVAGGILSSLGITDSVAGPYPGVGDCPSTVIELNNGPIQTVCGIDQPECEGVAQSREDVELHAVSTERLCEALRSPLCVGGRVEEVADFRQTYRVGSFIPEPAVRYPVYFVVRGSAREYAEAAEALRSREDGHGLAILVPTDRFVSGGTIQRMRALGIPIIPLQGLVDIDEHGNLITAADAFQIFAGVGCHLFVASALSGAIFAQARTRSGWHDLDEAAYRKLIQASAGYNIVADEGKGAVRKRMSRDGPPQERHNIPASYFCMVRAAIDKHGYFDPAVEGPAEERDDGKQTFQRARNAIDLKLPDETGHAVWQLFKSVKIDGHVVYQFRPESDCLYALIFLPPLSRNLFPTS